MDREKEKTLIEKYKYLFKEYDRSQEIMKRQLKNSSELHAAREAGNKEEIERLKEESKKIGSFYPVAFGIDCDSGWYDLLDELMGKIKELDTSESLRVTQIKEKLGGLRFYTAGSLRIDVIGDASYEFGNENSDIFSIIHSYEDKSYHICETCGQPGRLCESHGWLKTVCKEHRNFVTDWGIEHNYRPCRIFVKSEEVITPASLLTNVTEYKFDEDKDEWMYTLDNGDIWPQNELKCLPAKSLYPGWYAVLKSAPDQELVVRDSAFNVDDGWVYELSLPGSQKPSFKAKESDLEKVMDKKAGYIKCEPSTMEPGEGE